MTTGFFYTQNASKEVQIPYETMVSKDSKGCHWVHVVDGVVDFRIAWSLKTRGIYGEELFVHDFIKQNSPFKNI